MDLTLTKRRGSATAGWMPGVLMVLAAIVVVGAMATGTVYGKADNFTDIFYTNSFRGAFEWIKKLDWIGMIVQAVISVFSLFGVALMTIRIMTSMLYLSAKGLWEEVSDLKSGGESAEKDFIGLFGMAKTWASGKSGTGLDAIIGAILMILPDVKKYSDFGQKAGGDFGEDITISQYMLKIALPTVMTVFFFAMGFNGTLFQALAVTVDALGTLADKCITVNYAGIVDDLVNSQTGYKFYFNADGTNFGKFKQAAAQDMYRRVVATLRNPDSNQLYTIGQRVEEHINTIFEDPSSLTNANGVDAKVIEGLSGASADAFVNYVSCEVLLNGSSAQSGGRDGASKPLSELLADLGINTDVANEQYVHFIVRQSSNYNGVYMNFDSIND